LTLPQLQRRFRPARTGVSHGQAPDPYPRPDRRQPGLADQLCHPGSFGVFQIPIAAEFGWARSEFSLAIAIQNLAWGIGQPLFGAIAERFGDRRAIVGGALMYAAGLVLSAFATTPFAIQSLEVLVGFGIAGTGFGVILAIVGRAAAPEHRSMTLGIATAIGSAGRSLARRWRNCCWGFSRGNGCS
jgi:MFS family permease